MQLNIARVQFRCLWNTKNQDTAWLLDKKSGNWHWKQGKPSAAWTWRVSLQSHQSPKEEKIYGSSRAKTIILRETPSSTIQNDQLPIVMRFLAEKQWTNILDIYHHEVQLGSPIFWILFSKHSYQLVTVFQVRTEVEKSQGKLDTDGSSSHRSSLPGTATIPTYNEISTNKPHYEFQITKTQKIGTNYTNPT